MMLDGNFPITSREHRYFFAAVCLGLIVRVTETVLDISFPDTRPNIRFAIYSIFDHWELMSAIYCIAAFLICIPALVRLTPRGLILSLFPLGLLTYFFDYWFIDSQLRIRKIAEIAPGFELKTFDFLLLSGSLFDVLTFVLVNILVIWHVSLLVRLYRRHR